MLFTITFWTGDVESIEAENVHAAFAAQFGGPVTSTGYNVNGVWLSLETDDAISGIVLNNQGDQCATISATLDDAKTARKVARITANLDLVSMTETELEAERDRLKAVGFPDGRWNDHTDRQATREHLDRSLAVRDLLSEMNG